MLIMLSAFGAEFNLLEIFVSGGIFFVQEFFSNQKPLAKPAAIKEVLTKKKAKQILFPLFSRVIVMHSIPFIGAIFYIIFWSSKAVIVVFLSLKTVADAFSFDQMQKKPNSTAKNTPAQ